MPSQKTDKTTIEREMRLIRDTAGLARTDEIILNDRGWDSRVYSFSNGRYFFKFPRSEKIQKRYKYEIAALKLLEDRDAGVVISKILWEHPQNAYFGYEGVQGNSVSEIIETLSVSQKQSIGKALGTFLEQFHSFELPGARTMALEDESDQIQRWYKDNGPSFGKWFTGAEQQRLQQLVYEVWPAQLKKLGSESVLCHGDLGFSNVLYGHDGTVGIIDFGDVAYWDRSKDFLEIEDDKTIFGAARNVYTAFSEHLMEKITVRQAMIQIINFGYHAGKNDRVMADLTAEKIRATLTI